MWAWLSQNANILIGGGGVALVLIFAWGVDLKQMALMVWMSARIGIVVLQIGDAEIATNWEGIRG